MYVCVFFVKYHIKVLLFSKNILQILSLFVLECIRLYYFIVAAFDVMFLILINVCNIKFVEPSMPRFI